MATRWTTRQTRLLLVVGRPRTVGDDRGFDKRLDVEERAWWVRSSRSSWRESYER